MQVKKKPKKTAKAVPEKSRKKKQPSEDQIKKQPFLKRMLFGEEKPDLSELEAGSTTILDILSPTTVDTKSRDYIIVDDVYHAYLYITGYGYTTTVGTCWLAPLVEAGEGINLSFLVKRQPKEKILSKIAQTTMVNRSRMRDVGDTRQDYEELDSAISSGLYLKDVMNRQGENFYYMHMPLWSAVNPDKRIDWVKIGEYGWVYRYGAQAHLHRTKNERVLDQLTEIAQNPDAFYPIRGAHRRFPLSTYIKKKLRGRIDGFLCDELHEYNNNTMQAKAMKLMASKLAVAGIIEGTFSEEGLAAMSDVKDLTSQMAKELALGIRDNVEDIAAAFRKMAVMNPERKKNIAAAQLKETAAEEQKAPAAKDSFGVRTAQAQVRQALYEGLLARTAEEQKKRKSKKAEVDENQLSIFGFAA